MTIIIGSDERAAGKMTLAHLNEAWKAIREEGYIVLAEIVSHAHLDKLRERMDEDSRKLIAADQWVGAGRVIVPPVRCNAKKGSVLSRDIRLWHRGVPNPSDQPRHMIALIHNIRWLQRGKPLKFNKGCEAAFAGTDFDHNVEFSDEPID